MKINNIQCGQKEITIVDQACKCIGVLSMNTSTLLRLTKQAPMLSNTLRIANSVGFCIDGVLTPIIDPPKTIQNKIGMLSKLTGGLLMLGGTAASIAGVGVSASIASGVGLCFYTTYAIIKAAQIKKETPTCEKVSSLSLLGCLGMKFASNVAKIAGSPTVAIGLTLTGATLSVAYSAAGIAGLFQGNESEKMDTEEVPAPEADLADPETSIFFIDIPESIETSDSVEQK